MSRAPRLRLLVPALLAVALFLPARAQQQCWQLPPGADRPGYWYENYLKVEAAIKKGKLGAQEIDDAILRLQAAIQDEKSSSLRKPHPKDRYEFAYLPYYLLAVLYAEKGDVECAKKCLDREADYRAVQRSSFAQEFQQLQTALQRREDARQFVAVGRAVETLQQGGWLSAEGAAKAGEIRQGVQEVTTTTDDQRLAASTSTLATAVARLVEIEAGRLTGMIEELRSAAWTQAFPEGQVRADLGGCASAGQLSTKTDPGSLSQALQSLDTCRRSTEDSLRRAGESACGTLSARRDGLRRQVDFARESWPSALEGGVSVPDLPQACSSAAWAGASLADLWRSLQGLDFTTVAKTYADRQAELDGRVRTAQVQFRQELEQQRGRILVASKQCQSDLGLGSANETLGRLQRTLDRALGSDQLRPSAELEGIGRQVDQGVTDLIARARAGAEGLLGQRDELQGVDTAAFSSMPGARDALDPGNPSEAALTRLCEAARQAQVAIGDWGQKNLPQLARRVDGYRWLLRAAASWDAPPEAGLDCIGQSLDALPGPPGARAGAAWAERARQATGNADACLRDYRTARERWVADLRRDLEGAATSLERMPAAGDEALARRVEVTRRRLGDAVSAVERVAPVLDLAADASAETVRDTLQGAGLDIPADRWQRASDPQGVEPGKVLLAIRDEATNEPLALAARELSDNLLLVRRLGTFLALDNAFTAFSDGDLDGAILALRAGGGESDVTQGRAAALRHAALAFFLHTKSLTLLDPDRQETVTSLLVEDARAEVQAAFRAEPDFELPQTLIRDPKFREFVEDCRSM